MFTIICRCPLTMEILDEIQLDSWEDVQELQSSVMVETELVLND